ncbi:MAG TPA: VOC family protein [Planosporangium sp.]|jgi:catechol-2,3-dioxygenase|nr:VOC family protein [Planosporangium sp.]
MIGRLYSVVIDCPQPEELAPFYEELLGLSRRRTESDWVTIGDDTTQVAFQRVPDLREPRWPDPERPQQFHFDVAVDDVDAAEAKVLALGAKRLPGEGDDFRVYADPAGHPFCLVWDV